MLRYLITIACVVWLAGCKGPPIQEMSDARQAIAAARAAGAAERSPNELSAAQAAIARAEQDIQQQHFTRARFSAQEAKRRAATALANAQNSAGAGGASH
jgi:hypothetical protein